MKSLAILASLLLAAGVALAAPPAKDAAPPLTPGAVRDCPLCPELVTVPAGSFVLGTSADQPEASRATGEAPPLSVTMHKPYALSRTEITVAQFRAFADETGYVPESGCRVWVDGAWVLTRERDWRSPGFTEPQAEAEPVVCVSWDDARAYVDWLSKKAGNRYRLPSESEWEYAARGGTSTARYWGDHDSGENDLLTSACDYANVYDTTGVPVFGFPWANARCTDRFAGLAPVASFKPNGFDLVDMIGNAREWVQDCYTTSYVGRPPDARAWEWAGGCEERGVRGGSFATPPETSRAAARGGARQSSRQQDLGFRVARDAD